MSKFNSIEIADIVSLYPKVETHKFFGFFERVMYMPTRSRIESYRNYYDAPEAHILHDIAEGEDARRSLSELPEMNTSESGNYRLDICMSNDCKFVAFQVFERNQNDFVPYSKLCILEGEQAQAFENLLA